MYLSCSSSRECLALQAEGKLLVAEKKCKVVLFFPVFLALIRDKSVGETMLGAMPGEMVKSGELSQEIFAC